MDKREFLSALEQSLSVLQEDELRDIISEYEQHIDIKVEKGLTEAEAIADFGSFGELTAEILEAYHVRADYASDRKERTGRGESGQAVSWKSRGAMIWEKVKNGGLRAVTCVRWTGRQLFRPFLWAWRKCRELLGGLRERQRRKEIQERELWEFDGSEAGQGETAREERGEYGTAGLKGRDDRGTDGIIAEGGHGERGSETGKPDVTSTLESGRRGGIPLEKGIQAYGDAGPGDRSIGTRPGRRRGDRDFRANRLRQKIKRKGKRVTDNMGKGILWVFRLGARAICWAARMVWNGCWILFSLMTGGFGLFSLYGLGVLSVLLIQGYPLIGVTLGCLGLVMCAFAAAVLGTTFLWKKQNGVVKSKGSRDCHRNMEQKTGKPADQVSRDLETERSLKEKRESVQEEDRQVRPGARDPWQADQEEGKERGSWERPREQEYGREMEEVWESGREDQEPVQEDRGTGQEGKTLLGNPGKNPAGDQKTAGERGQRHA